MRVRGVGGQGGRFKGKPRGFRCWGVGLRAKPGRRVVNNRAGDGLVCSWCECKKCTITAVLNGSEVRDDLILSFRAGFWQGRRADLRTDIVPLGPPDAPKPTPQVPPGGSEEYHLLPSWRVPFRHG